MPLSPDMGSSTYVHDFVKSKNKRFKGKSKAKRTQMALGAFYGAKKDAAPPSDNPNPNPYNDGNRKYSYSQYKPGK
jgi:hypothetical protein